MELDDRLRGNKIKDLELRKEVYFKTREKIITKKNWLGKLDDHKIISRK